MNRDNEVSEYEKLCMRYDEEIQIKLTIDGRWIVDIDSSHFIQLKARYNNTKILDNQYVTWEH